MIRRLLRLNNKRFLLLFARNTALVFSGIAVLLAITTGAVYFFANRQLVQEVDAANMRSVEVAISTIDSVVAGSREMASRLSDDRNVYRLVVGPAPIMPHTYYAQRAIEVLWGMRLNRRHLLDHSLFLYLSGSGYSICTMRGGQFVRYHTDQDIVRMFIQLRAEKPNARDFTVTRQAYFNLADAQPVQLLTFYHEIRGTLTGDSFIAINVDVNALAGYLVGTGHEDGARFIVFDDTGYIVLDTGKALAGYSISTLIHNEADVKNLLNDPTGNLTVQMDDGIKRLSWLSFPRENWILMQMIPFDAYMANMLMLRNFIMAAISFGLLFSLVAALGITMRIFRPIADIIRIMENPGAYNMQEKDGEINVLLLNVLNSFQKNILLEEEMLQKISALRDTRVTALQKQISPHFMYNTLQVVNWLAIAETKLEDSDTSKAVVALAEIIHEIMDQSDNLTTVAKEVEHLLKYMDIISLWYGEEITLALHITPGTEDLKILRITLQPLVENAIQHGIQHNGGKGTVYVDISKKENRLLVCVEDDGVGMDARQLEEYNQLLQLDDLYTNRHIGLLNLCQRVRLVYGEQYGLTLSPSQHGGLKVEVSIPLV